jgi:tetratricopeptide (TPR) repeat protein
MQVGNAAMADRYTYFPLVGVFIAVTFGGRDLAARFRFPKAAMAAAAALILAGCLALTEHQLRYWHDSESLFAHTVAVAPGDNPNARVNYGMALEQKGLPIEALAQYREAVRLAPDNAGAHYDNGNLLANLGQPEEALPELLKAVQLDPNQKLHHASLGAVLAELGRFHEAMNELTNAIRLDPDYPWPHFEMAKVFLKQGRDAEAIGELREALRVDPDNFQILAYTAHVLAANENPQIRDGQAALAYAARANVLDDGALPFVLDALGMACAETGHFDDAQAATQKAIELMNAAGMGQGVADMQRRLQLYQNHQPWRESFRSNSAPSEKSPKN